MTSDLGLALKSFGRQPALAGVVVATLATALAANASLFAIFDGLLFKPLPYPAPDAIVRVEIPRGLGLSNEAFVTLAERLVVTPMLVEGTRAARASVFEEGTDVVIDWRLQPVGVSPAFFDLFGTRPVLGRAFTADDSLAGALVPVILGHDLWRLHFAGDPQVVGRVIDIPGSLLNRRWQVIGVMPQGFEFPIGANVWLPAGQAPAGPAPPDFARLSAHSTIEALRREFPQALFTPLREYVTPGGARAFGYLVGATGLLMFVAWIQIAALLFARARGRTREIGIRLGLGATRARLIRQFATESALVGGATLGLAWLATPALTAVVVRWLPAEMTMGQSLTPDGRTFWCASAASLVGVALLTLMPALSVRRATPVTLLRVGAGTDTRDAIRARTSLMVIQIALTATLVYVAALAVHSFSAVSAAPLGFRPDRLVAVRLPLITTGLVPPAPGQPLRIDPDHLQRQIALQMQSLDAVRATPGVVASAGVSRYPFQPGEPPTALATARSDPQTRELSVGRFAITRGFVETLGLSMVDGRDFSDVEVPNRLGIVTDSPTGSATALSGGDVMLVNERLAQELEPFGSVVGQGLVMGDREYRVSGVVTDMAWHRPDVAPGPQVFVVSALQPLVLARVAAGEDVAQTGRAIQSALERLWADRASREVIHVEDALARVTADYRARSMLLALVAALCLPLAVAGLVGAQMDVVRRRSREIAIRLALGADAAGVRRRLVAGAMRTVGLGAVAGLAGGVVAGRVMSAHLFGVGALDASSAVIAIVVLLGVAWLGAAWPARCAARIDPAVVLRGE